MANDDACSLKEVPYAPPKRHHWQGFISLVAISTGRTMAPPDPISQNLSHRLARYYTPHHISDIPTALFHGAFVRRQNGPTSARVCMSSTLVGYKNRRCRARRCQTRVFYRSLRSCSNVSILSILTGKLDAIWSDFHSCLTVASVCVSFCSCRTCTRTVGTSSRCLGAGPVCWSLVLLVLSKLRLPCVAKSCGARGCQ